MTDELVEVHLWAAARQAAGTELVRVAPGTVRTVLDELLDTLPPAFGPVLERCSLLLDSGAVHDPTTPVPGGHRLDVLPPFAGG